MSKDSNVFILIDVYNNKAYSFVEQLSDVPLKVVTPPAFFKSKYIQWLLGCLLVMLNSRENDTIICIYDFQAILCFWLGRLFFMRRKYICINVLLKDKSTMRNRIVSLLYKPALSSNRVKATVTSKDYGAWLNKKLKISTKYVLLHDVYHDEYHLGYLNEPTYKVFCGGRNGRDWDFMMKIAKKMNDVNFVFVMPKDVQKKYATINSPNISILFDIPYGSFLQELCGCSIVCLPLDTNAPAGLIVMFQAAANSRFVITTKTCTTKEYISPERGELIVNNVDEWCEKIKFYLNNHEIRKRKAENLKSFLESKCSEREYVKTITSILNDFKDHC